MKQRDLLAAIYVARAMLKSDNANAAFENSVSAARDKYSSRLKDAKLFALAHALSGFGMEVRGDFDKIPVFSGGVAPREKPSPASPPAGKGSRR